MTYLKLIYPMLNTIIDALAKEAQKKTGDTGDKWVRIGAETLKTFLTETKKEFKI